MGMENEAPELGHEYVIDDTGVSAPHPCLAPTSPSAATFNLPPAPPSCARAEPPEAESPEREQRKRAAGVGWKWRKPRDEKSRASTISAICATHPHAHAHKQLKPGLAPGFLDPGWP